MTAALTIIASDQSSLCIQCFEHDTEVEKTTQGYKDEEHILERGKGHYLLQRTEDKTILHNITLNYSHRATN